MHPVLSPVATGLFSHAVFWRCEPRTVTAYILLLAGPPIGLLAVAPKTNCYSEFARIFFFHISVLLLSVIAYRLSPFHPLSKYPGPLLYRISEIWALWTVYRGKQYRSYHALHERYGPVVRIGPNHLLFREVEAIPTVMGPQFHRGGRYEAHRPKWFQGAILTLTDPRLHGLRRRIWDRAFTSSAIKQYEPALHGRVQEVQMFLREHGEGGIDLSKLFTTLTFDFMGDITYGGLFNLLGGESNRTQFIDNMHRDVLQYELTGTIEWIRPIALKIPYVRTRVKHMYDVGSRALDLRTQRYTYDKDLFYHMLKEDNADGDAPLDRKTQVSEASFAIIAGSDTTGTALSNIFYYLLTHPEAYSRLQKEVDTLGENLNEPRKLSNVPYLNAVIQETLRLQPLVPSGIPRRKPYGSTGIMVAGWYVPPGTTVQIPMWSIHRDPRYFSPHPESFIPERWLADSAISKEPEFRLNKNAFVPWSYGAMNCAGKPLAQFEMRFVLATILRQFELTLDTGKGWTQEQWNAGLFGHYILLKGSLPVISRSRE